MTTLGPADTAGEGVAPSVGFAAGARTALRDMLGSIRSVFRNPGLRRVELALTGSLIGDWAYATAVTVWAYEVGGVTAVGIWSAVRLTLMAATAPVGAMLADRFPRKSVMIGADLPAPTVHGQSNR